MNGFLVFTDCRREPEQVLTNLPLLLLYFKGMKSRGGVIYSSDGHPPHPHHHPPPPPPEGEICSTSQAHKQVR